MMTGFELIRVSSLVVLAFFSNALSWYLLPLFTISYVTWGLIMLMGMLMFIFTPNFIQPVEPPKKSKISALILGVLITIPLLVFLVLLFPSLPRPLGAAISDYRVGGLLAIATYLLVILVSVLTTPSTLLPLINLRRRLALGKISFEAALIQTEIILGGMRAVDALRDSYFNLTILINRIDEHNRNAAMSLESMEANMPNPNSDDKAVLENKSRTLISIEGGYRYFLGEREKYVELFKVQFKKFYEDARKILRVMPAGTQTIQRMQQLLRSRIELSDKQYFSLTAKHEELFNRIKQKPPEEHSDKKP